MLQYSFISLSEVPAPRSISSVTESPYVGLLRQLMQQDKKAVRIPFETDKERNRIRDGLLRAKKKALSDGVYDMKTSTDQTSVFVWLVRKAGAPNPEPETQAATAQKQTPTPKKRPVSKPTRHAIIEEENETQQSAQDAYAIMQDDDAWPPAEPEE